MVLAAGRGTRLAPLTDRLPKPLMPVAGRADARAHPRVPARRRHRRGGDQPASPRPPDRAGDRRRRAASASRVRYSWEPAILDTGGGIKQAEPLLGGRAVRRRQRRQPARAVRCATWSSFHRARGGIATMVVRPAPDAARWGLIELDADDRVRRVVGRPDGSRSTAPLRGFMFPGLHVFEPGSSAAWTRAALQHHPRDLSPAAPRRRADLRLRHRGALGHHRHPGGAGGGRPRPSPARPSASESHSARMGSSLTGLPNRRRPPGARIFVDSADSVVLPMRNVLVNAGRDGHGTAIARLLSADDAALHTPLTR